MNTALLGLDEEWRVTYVNDRAESLLDRPRERLVGRPLGEVFPAEPESPRESAFERAMRTQEPVDFVEHHPREGREFAIRASPAETGLSVSVREVTGRTRREDRMAGLVETLSTATEVDDAQELCDVAVDASRDRLDLPVTLIARTDRSEEVLEPVARTPLARRHVDETRLFDADGPAWAAFTTGTATEVDDPDVLDEASGATRLLVSPLGRHGVFVTAVADGGRAEREFVETVVGALRAEFDRIAREELLRDHEAALEERADRLDRLNSVFDVFRRVDRALVQATTREAVETAVCVELVDGGPYRFAWVGEYDAARDVVEPREWAVRDGAPAPFPRSFASEAVDRGPAVRAATERAPQVVEDGLVDAPVHPWQTARLARGHRSCIGLPLIYRDRLYGVLCVYADETGVFEGVTRDVLCELADTVAYARNAIEIRRSLLSDEVVELQFDLTDADVPLLEPVRRLPEATFELESIVPGEDETHHLFVTLSAAADVDVSELVAEIRNVEQCTLVSERKGDHLLECTLTGENVVSWLLDHGAVPQALRLDEGSGRLTVELPGEADVREFVEPFQATFEGVDMVARRERERTVQTRQEFQADVEERLTARQAEVLRVAFASGYFETPRDASGKDLATTMGISQPTFSDHLRAALRKTLTLLFDEEGGT